MISDSALDDVSCQLVMKSLNRGISLDQLTDYLTIDSYQIERLTELNRKLYEKDQYNGRKRSFEQIERSTLKGFLCEMAVYYLLAENDLTPSLNVIDPSDHNPAHFNYDISCNGLRLEVKTVPLGNTFFSYSLDDEHDYLKVKNFRENWYDYDAIIGVKTDFSYSSRSGIFLPWVFIDSKAFDPSRSLFIHRSAGDEYEKERWFMKMHIARNQNLLAYLT